MLKEFLLTLLDLANKPMVKPDPFEASRDPASSRIVLVRDGWKTVELPQPRAVRPIRAHVYQDITSFAAFVKKTFPDGGPVEILAGQKCIKAVSAVEHLRDEVACDLPFHPLLLAWQNLFGKKYTQGGLYKVLAPVSDTILRPILPNGDLGAPWIAQLQSVQIDSSGGVKMSLNELGMYTLRSQSSTTQMSSALDSRIRIRVPIYLDDVDGLDVQLAVLVDNEGGLTFSLVPVDLEVVIREAYMRKVRLLQELLGEAYLVGVGELGLAG